MKKEPPLLDRIYADPLYQAICRFVGYGAKTYRELQAKLELLGEAYGKSRTEYAYNQLLAYEGQYTCNPKPLVEVKLRGEVRKHCFMLLGPPPETWDSFYRNPDGTPMAQHAEKMAELEGLTGKKTEPKPKSPRGKAPMKPIAPPEAEKRGKPKTKPKSRRNRKENA